ncbi:MAG TPA: ChaN family lipoprotein [Terriglobales bacterium]
MSDEHNLATSVIGERRNAAQLHALADVQREVRAYDQSSRRKYLQEFYRAFQAYESIIDAAQLDGMISVADLLLVADYHALPTAQRYAASLLEKRAQPGDRPVVLGVETIFARHQHILDEWWRREIDAEEFRQRIRFDIDWGYDWAPFYELLVTAREHAEAIYGLDCMPRDDLRKIGARDRHAADKIAEIRGRHPNAVIMVLFGESHVAPSHLPAAVREQLPAANVLTVLQNIDALYWQVTSERQEQVEAVKVSRDTVCVFNATPLEKYESYRLYLSRCTQDENHPDGSPTFYNLVDGLIRFLGINRHSPTNTTQPKFLVDLLPEVYCGSSDARLRQILLRATGDTKKVDGMLARVEAQGSVYLPSINAFYLRDFQMVYAAEEAARFLHHACRGLPLRNGVGVQESDAADRFYIRTLEHALAYFGSRVLYPARPAVRAEDGSELTRGFCERLAQDALRGDREKFNSTALELGYTLGSELYGAYIKGAVSPRVLRSFFLAHLEAPGSAKRVCMEVLKKSKATKRCR